MYVNATLAFEHRQGSSSFFSPDMPFPSVFSEYVKG